MANILNLPFQSASDFASCRWLGANGVFAAGSTLPTGIPNRIWVEDNACQLVLDVRNDLPDASGWMRSEVDFGEFTTATGEFWVVFDFKYNWSFKNYVVIASISVMIDGSSGLTYVPLGFRVKNHALLIQAPADLSGLGFNNIQLAMVPIQPERWYRVCAHVNLKSDTTGYREVFLDDMAIVRQYNLQTTYSTASAHYFKAGIYDGDHLEEFDYATMALRNVAMWEGNDGYNAVMGGAPRISQRLIYI